MKIAAIVVTHNRLDLLRQVIQAIRDQTYVVDEIFVVDNASSDGTKEWLLSQDDLSVIHSVNVGSSGGQNIGLRAAYKNGHDWFWCMDDDTLPQKDSLWKLMAFEEIETLKPGFLCSVVKWRDGAIHLMNAPRLSTTLESLIKYRDKNAFPITSCSFVSVLFSREAVQKCGLPIRDMFIWSDDVEYTQRISAHYTAFIIMDSIVTHYTQSNPGSRPEYSKWPISRKSFCVVANTLLTLRRAEPSFLVRSAKCILYGKQILTESFRSRDFRVITCIFAQVLRGFCWNPEVEFVGEERPSDSSKLKHS